MNRAPRQPSEPSALTRPGFPTFTIVGTLGLLVLVSIILWQNHRSEAPSAPARAVETESAQPAADQVASQWVPANGIPAPTLRHAPNQSVRADSSDLASGPGSAVAGQLIGRLTQLQIAAGKLTSEQGRQVQQSLRQLVAQGAAALPSIREYLDKNLDLPFGEDGSKLAGVPSLRAGLIDSLRQIGGPESLALSRQVLQNNADPLEISLLARNLEDAAPGQYREETLNAARQALAQVTAGNLDVKDTGPLFQVLQTYGDATIATELQKLAPQWNYYATMALAGLPGGAGITALADLAHQPLSPETGQYNKLPLQMLAQLSSQYPEAGSTLIDMARQNQIPENAWRAVAAGLGGNQYQFDRQLPQNAFPPGSTIESGSSMIGGRTETFFSLPLGADASAPDVSQRLAIIDQLLSAASGNPAAVTVLNQARAKLSIGTGPK